MSRQKIAILLPLTLVLLTAYQSAFSQKKLFKKVSSSSSMVLVVDGKRIAKKVDFDQIRALEFYKDLDEKAAANLKEKYEYVSYLYKNPKKAGINLEKKLIVAYDFSNQFSPDFQVMIPLSSKSKFQAFLKNSLDSSDLKNEQKAGKSTIFRNGSIIFGYTGSYLFLTSIPYMSDRSRDEIAKEKAIAINRIEKNNSILKNPNFKLFLKDEYDAGYWFNTGSFITDVWQNLLTSAVADIDTTFLNKDLYQDSYMHLLLNFNKGDITYQTKQYLSPALSSDLDKLYASKFNEEILKYFRKGNLLASMSYSLNVSELKNYWEKNFSSFEKIITDEALKKIYEKSIKEDSVVGKLDEEIDSLNSEIYSLEMAQYDYDYDSYEYEDDAVYEELEEDEEYVDYEDYEEEGSEETDQVTDSIESEETTEPEEEEAISEDITEDVEFEEIEMDTVYEEEYIEEYVPTEEELQLDSLRNVLELKEEELRLRKAELLEEKKAAFPYNNEELWSIFEGDIIAAVTDVRYEEKTFTSYEYDETTEEIKEVEKTRKEPVPVFIVASTVNNIDVANRILGQIEEKGLIKKENNVYLVIPGNSKMYVALLGNMLLFTNNELLIQEHITGYKESEQLDIKVKQLITNNNFSMYVDFKEIFARFPKETFNDDKTYSIFTAVMNALQNMEAYDAYAGESITSGKVQINFTNKIDNSMFEIFRIVNIVYLEFRSKF